MDGLNFCLFGVVKVTRQGDPREELRIIPLAQALLVYLLLFPRQHRREVLIDLFWGGNNLDAARRCLSTTLWRLRRELEAGQREPYILITANGDIGFNTQSPHQVDVAIFEENVRYGLLRPLAAMGLDEIAALETAAQLYCGDLAESIYSNWILSPREHLRSLYLKTLSRLMEYYERQKLYERSIAYGRQIIVMDPLREEVHRMLMRLHYQDGQRGEAIRQYETCRRLLAQELHVRPMAETDSLFECIVASQELEATPLDSHEPGELSGVNQRLDTLINGLEELREQVQQMLRAVQALTNH